MAHLRPQREGPSQALETLPRPERVVHPKPKRDILEAYWERRVPIFGIGSLRKETIPLLMSPP